MKNRKLFCEISPLTYSISFLKGYLVRAYQNILKHKQFATTKNTQVLPYLILKHQSLIHRQLGDVDATLQNNKATNLGIAAPKVTNIIIRPGEIFSFWKLVGSCTKRKGYQEGLIIRKGKVDKGIGGGMCQFTNLIHWMVLHTPLEIVEHHHHDGLDLFPDYGRQVPFGVGTPISYNYIDYRFKNTTDSIFQLIVYTTETHLCGEIRADKPLAYKYHIRVEEECFLEEEDGIYRTGKVFRECIDKKTGNKISYELLKENHAKVLYDRTLTKTI